MADNQDVVNLINPSGSLVGLPAQSAREAMSNGYKLASPEEVNQHFERQDYTSGINPALAAVAGFLRGGTLGLSDLGLTKTGLVKSETLKKLEDYNPAESISGEGLAIGTSLLIPGEGEAAAASGAARAAARTAGKALLGPLEGVSAAGRAITKGVQAALPEASGPIGRIASSGLAHGIAGSAEGAAFGLGRAISEHSMGDPDALGEKMMSHIGFSAMIGGGIGGAIGATAGLGKEAYGSLRRSFPEVPSPSEVLASKGISTDPEFDVGSLGDITGMADKTPAERESFLKGLKKRSPNANDVEAVAQKRGLPVLEEMLTTDEPLLKTAEALRDSNTPIGHARVRELQKGWDYWRDELGNMLPEASGQSQKEMGDSIATRLADRFSEEQSDFTSRFNKRNGLQEDIPIADKMRYGLMENGEKAINDAKWKVGSEPQIEANKAINTIIAANDGAELAQQISLINEQAGALFRAGKSQAGSMVNEIKNLAKKMLQDEIVNHAANPEEMIAEYNKLNSDYAAFSKQRQEALRGLGIAEGKKTYQVKDILLNKMNPQTLVKKLFNNNNVRVAEFFNKYAPEIMADVKSYQLGELKEAALDSQNKIFNPKNLIKEVDGMEKELKNILFTPDQQMALKEGSVYLNSFPKKFNGSGTASAINYMGMGKLFNIFNTGDMGAAWANLAKDVYSSAKLRAAGLKTEDLAHANWLAKSIEKTNQKIVSGAKSVFKAAEKGEMPAVGFAAEKSADKMIDHENQRKLISQINELQSNPEKFIEQLNKSTAPIFKIAPGTASAAQQSTVRAVKYLAASAPQLKSPYPLGEDFTISKADLHVFAERVYTVNNPTVIMDELRAGTIVPAHLEAVATVYPKLYQEMQQSVLTQLNNAVSKKKDIPYKTRNMLSMFLGKDLDASITPQSVLANQASLAQSQMTQGSQNQAMTGQMGKSTQKGLDHLMMSNNLRTDMQKSAQRIEKS